MLVSQTSSVDLTKSYQPYPNTISCSLFVVSLADPTNGQMITRTVNSIHSARALVLEFINQYVELCGGAKFLMFSEEAAQWLADNCVSAQYTITGIIITHYE